MSLPFVAVNSVLQAGHWKSLKISMVTGALLEPKAVCGSTSDTVPGDCGTPAVARSTQHKPKSVPATASARICRRITRSSPRVNSAKIYLEYRDDSTAKSRKYEPRDPLRKQRRIQIIHIEMRVGTGSLC